MFTELRFQRVFNSPLGNGFSSSFPLRFSLTHYSLALFFCQWPREMKRGREKGGVKLNFPLLFATGQMYFHYFIPSVRSGLTLKRHDESHEGGDCNGIPLVPRRRRGPSRSQSVRRSCCHRTRSPNSFFTAFQTVTSSSLARGLKRGDREGEGEQGGWHRWLVFCVVTI